MPENLEKLIAAAARVKFTAVEKEEQRRSFAYGNAHIENVMVTRATVDAEADALVSRHKE
jgi:DNA-binding PucR family transcriptional regulator